MKKISTIFLSALFGLGVIMIFGKATNYANGRQGGGYTGSPGDGMSCAKSGCHRGTATTVTGVFSSNIPDSGYTPGSNYTITVNIPGSSRKGFEASPQTQAGDLVGTLTKGANMTLSSGGKSVISTSSSLSTYTFTWKAPAAGAGDVTFYGAVTSGGLAVTNLSTMTVSEAAVNTGVSENVEISNNITVYPNPTTENIKVSYNLVRESNVNIQLRDMSGRIVKSLLNENISSTGNVVNEFNLGSDVAKGNYILLLNIDGKISTKKIVKN